MPTRLIGLTGGISSGKTTVSNYLAQKYNLTILDADIYARDAVAPGSPILKAIFTRYGDRVRADDGNLNRFALGAIIFNDGREKAWLEAQIHPYVRECFQREIARKSRDTIVLSIPLLFEANFTDLVEEIWVVFCDRKLQLDRLQQRDNLNLQQAEIRLNSQMPLAEKIKLADIVLDNSGDLSDLYHQIDVAIAKD